MPDNEQSGSILIKLKNQTGPGLKEVNKGLQETGNTVSKIKDKLKEHGNELKGLIAGYFSYEAAMRAIEKAAESDKATQALKSALGVNKDLLEVLQAQGEEIQKNTKFDKDSVSQAQANLIERGVQLDRVQGATRAAVDMSAALNKSLEESANIIAVTYQGIIPRAIGRVVPELKKLTQEQLKQGDAVDILAKKFKGYAEAAAKTPFGQVKVAQNRIDDVWKSVGNSLVKIQAGVLPKIAGLLETIASALDDLTEGAQGSGTLQFWGDYLKRLKGQGFQGALTTLGNDNPYLPFARMFGDGTSNGMMSSPTAMAAAQTASDAVDKRKKLREEYERKERQSGLLEAGAAADDAYTTAREDKWKGMSQDQYNTTQLSILEEQYKNKILTLQDYLRKRKEIELQANYEDLADTKEHMQALNEAIKKYQSNYEDVTGVINNQKKNGLTVTPGLYDAQDSLLQSLTNKKRQRADLEEQLQRQQNSADASGRSYTNNLFESANTNASRGESDMTQKTDLANALYKSGAIDYTEQQKRITDAQNEFKRSVEDSIAAIQQYNHDMEGTNGINTRAADSVDLLRAKLVVLSKDVVTLGDLTKNSLQGPMESAFTAIITGSGKAREIFGNFLKGVAGNIANFISQQLTNKLISGLFSFVPGGFFGTQVGTTAAAGAKNKGGFIRGFSTGGQVPGPGNSANRDTVPAALTPGEFVLQRQAASAIGPDALYHFNNGNVQAGISSILSRNVSSGSPVGGGFAYNGGGYMADVSRASGGNGSQAVIAVVPPTSDHLDRMLRGGGPAMQDWLGRNRSQVRSTLGIS